MRKLWDVLVDLVYEDAWQFFGPLAALFVVALLLHAAIGPLAGAVLLLLVSGMLVLSLRRER